jgi:hypothetical protein
MRMCLYFPASSIIISGLCNARQNDSIGNLSTKNEGMVNADA